MQNNLIPFSIGAIGDFILQCIVNSSDQNDLWGLKYYFERHGRMESIFIAGGMMQFFTVFYEEIDPSLNTIGLIVYGSLIDLVFRYFDIFNSLENYYQKLSVPVTMFWGFFPLLLFKYILNSE